MRKAFFIGLFFAFAVFLAAAAFSISRMSIHRQLDVSRSESFDVMRKLDSIVTSILDAENAWNNFARSPRNQAYKEAYNSAIDRTFKIRDELRNVYSGANSNESFDDLLVLISSRVDVLNELMAAVTKGVPEKMTAETLRREELINNAFFQGIQVLEKLETDKILELDDRMETLSRESIYSLMAGACLSVITFFGLFYSLHQELKARKRLEQEIKRQAHSDQLTGLPNRLSYLERLGYEMTQANRYRQRLAILFLDIDHFKDVNDTLGHEAGDTLLKEAAVRMKAGIREADTVARIGGDEFNILLTNIVRTEDISFIAEKMIASFTRPFTITGHEIRSSLSIGISIYPEDGRESTELLKNADIALYHAKEQGRNNFKFYNRFLNRRTREKEMLESHLRHALEKDEMVLYYQPVISMRGKKVVCVEALARWRHPEKGLLMPPDFISAAEGIGYISFLDEWVLRTACGQVSKWRKDRAEAICLTVNISTREFRKPDFEAIIRSTLSETRFDPRCLELEISEQTAMEGIEETAAKIRDLENSGVRFAVDQFGTGAFSLNNLTQLSVDRIKIDRSVIRKVGASEDARNIVMATIAMAHSLNIIVVAEGVENREQLAFLEEYECDEAQGYLFCAPVPAHEFKKFAASYAA